MALTSKLTLALTASLSVAQDFGSAAYAPSVNDVLADLADGGGLNQARFVWSDQRSLNATTAETINVDAPVVRDVLGQTLALTKIKALYIRNRGTNATDILKIGGEGTADAWNSILDGSDTAKSTIEPGGALIWVAPSAAGFAVANPGNYKLKIENMGSVAVTYDIWLIGF